MHDVPSDTPLGAPATTFAASQSSIRLEDVAIDVSRLIIGREIQHPIHDRTGVLLLRAGSLITSDFKRNLERRSMASICVHPDDAGRIAFHSGAVPIRLPAGGNTTRPASFDTEVSRQIDDLLVEGLPFVSNQGPAARRSRVFHGMRPYDAGLRPALEDSRRQTCELLTGLMQGAVLHQEIDGPSIAGAVGEALRQLMVDFDQAQSLSFEFSRDQNISQHGMQLSLLGMAIGIELGLNAENVCRIGVAGMVHDWGMLKVPQELRDAGRRLTEAEMIEIRRHPIYTLDLLERVSGLPSLVPVISYQVHEKIDGTGYPRGRVERNIHLFSRILHVADIYVALTSPRPWRPAYSTYAAICSLLSCDNPHGCDPLIVRALLRVKSLFPVGSFVALSDASVAQVLRTNGDRYTEPIVQLVQDSQGRPLKGSADAVLVDLTQSPLRVTEALPTPGRDELTTPGHFVKKRHEAPSPAHQGVRKPHLPLSSSASKSSSETTREAPHIPRPHLRMKGARRQRNAIR